MEKKDRLLRLIEHYSDGNKSEFARMIGVSPQAVNTWISRNTFDIDIVYANCINVSPEWLLTGKGPMLKPTIEESQVTTQPSTPTAKDRLPEAFRCLDPLHATQELIPLVTPKVAAGFGSADFSIAESDIKDYYIIPKWRRQRVDFMIEVTGDSMQPKYSAGDIVGCTIIQNSSFIQWNRPHVIATREQGILVKRLMPGTTSNTISAVSDNPKYPPFDIPKNEITGIALIIGMVGLE
ncbi:LexA family transcriptional regulator [Prevotella denticola]|uniref:LexA family transcriptional regulator n=1 Tax=Prevotella denticola TaxID=28129 RepID=UPI001BC852FF|nr:S24 family peptidase [Prevotella denticola]QUI93650.1 helix-turn-helix domain-containing protein [Prevotella denticola]